MITRGTESGYAYAVEQHLSNILHMCTVKMAGIPMLFVISTLSNQAICDDISLVAVIAAAPRFLWLAL